MLMREENDMPKLMDVSEDCATCSEYIEQMGRIYKHAFMKVKENYQLKSDVIEKLQNYREQYEIVVLFADWCGDARNAVPVLALLEERLGIRIRALGGMKKPGPRARHGVHWAVPPSPKEVDIFGITSSPTILIFDRNSGEEIARIKTKPRIKPTIEEEILFLIEQHAAVQQNS